jgi:predicted transcriptional regulator
MLTPREMEILDVLRKGIRSPTLVAAELRITQSGATQALQKLENKEAVTRTKIGRNVFYRPIEDEKPGTLNESDVDIELIMESYHALSKIWSHLLRLDLTHEELAKVRDARNILEEILVRRGKSLD